MRHFGANHHRACTPIHSTMARHPAHTRMHPQVEASEFSEHMEPVSTGLATLIKTTKARALETIYQVTRVHLLRARMCGGSYRGDLLRVVAVYLLRLGAKPRLVSGIVGLGNDPLFQRFAFIT